MTMNIEKIVTHFAEIDPRYHRAWEPPRLDYDTHRYGALLPSNIIQNKTILDLGACVGAAGAWSLHHECAHWTGVELQKELFDIGNNALQQFFSKDQFDFKNVEIENFIQDNKQFYDIILLSSVLQCLGNDWLATLQWCMNHSNYIVIDSTTPHLINEFLTETQDVTEYSPTDRDFIHTLLDSRLFNKFFRKFIAEQLPMVYYRKSNSIFVSVDGTPHVRTAIGAYANLGWYKNFFRVAGWQYVPLHMDLARSRLDTYQFPHRFCCGFFRVNIENQLGLKSHYDNYGRLI